ncbi:MAG: ABC transporter permease [Sandaracinus sp.]|nr:ABC transporter permease [Sandaracinus sp.]MCB9633426.1 ABC transporter permease [Sandaracinus sp.]
MAYAFQIGMRHLRSKKRSTVSVITFIAVTGVALGVAALLAVLSITTGFQQAFRDKVLGVNAHVLVMKYGVDFDEYRDVIARAEAMPEVAGAGPFLIQEMMLAKGDRLAGVLVKGVDPERMPTVLDLPDQIIDGSLRGLRREGAHPPLHPDDVGSSTTEDWNWLDDLAEPRGDAPDEGPSEGSEESEIDVEAALEELREDPTADLFLPDGGLRPALRRTPVWGDPAQAEPVAPATPAAGPDDAPLPEVQVASPSEVEALLDGFDPSSLELPSDEWEDDILAEENALAEADAEATENLPGIVVGHALARTLGLGVGDRVRLVSPLSGLDTSMIAPEARTPRSRELRVIAIFEAGFQEYDTRLVYTDLYEAQNFYGQGDAATGVELRLHDLDRSEEVARRLERELGGPFHTLDWAELNRNLFTALEIQKITLGFVIATIIFVAAFNVIATLIMIVLEKKREIAILKAMGATDGTVLGVFMLQGSIIGVIGTLVGLLLGGGVVLYLATVQMDLDPKVYLIDHLPVVVSWVEFAVTAAVAFAICTIATVAPSLWAARMLPVEGLRHE